MYVDVISTPIGNIEINATETDLVGTYFSDTTGQAKRIQKNTVTELCKQQLFEYFQGNRKVFDITLALQGTEFQKSIWSCLVDVPFGQVASYQDIANSAGNSKAVRAVGAANGKNPIAIIVPCHRIIGSNGKLTGYAGGLERKRWLLNHEGIAITA